MLRVLDVRILPYKTSHIFMPGIEVKVKVKHKDGHMVDEWVEPDYHFIRRLCRGAVVEQWTETRWRKMLVGKMIPIPKYETWAEKEGYKITRARRGKGHIG